MQFEKKLFDSATRVSFCATWTSAEICYCQLPSSQYIGQPAEHQWLSLVYLFYYVPIVILLGDQVSSEHGSSGPVIEGFLSG